MMARLLICAAFAVTLAAQNTETFDDLAARADAARDAGKLDQAVTLYQQALHLKPDWKQGWWVVGSILYDRSRYKEGEEAFLPLTLLDPNKSAGWAIAGLCEFEINHYQDALTNLRKAEQLGLPTSLYDVVQYHVDLILIRTGQFDQAIEAIRLVAARREENPKLVEAMGIAGLRRPALPGDIPAADHDLAAALGRAMCDGAANNVKAAIGEFDALIAAHPNVPQLHYLYGMVLLHSDTDRAIAEFKQELTVSPRSTQALISIAAQYAERNDYQAALPYAQQALNNEPKYFAVHAMLGKVLVEGGLDVPRGIKELEKAAEMAPANPQTRLALASAYSKVGRKTDAATQRAEFLRLRNQADANAAVRQ
jgi:tetratricopeptide (TPR) repeat protein